MRIVESASPWRRLGPAYLETAFCIAVLILIPCLLMAPSLLHGELPWAADPLFLLAPWSEARPVDLAEPRMGDAEFLNRHYPWYRYLSDHATDPASLLWNPREGGGTPFFALWRTRCLSPFSLLFYVLPLATALIASVFLKFLVAGLCAYYAARKFELAKPFALFAAVSFQLSGSIFLFRGGPVSDSAVWLPLLILYIDAWVTHRAAPWRAHAFVSLLILLGGAPEVGAGAFILALAFPIVLMLSGRLGFKHGAYSIAVYVGMVLLSACMAAIQFLPTIYTALETELTAFPERVPLSYTHMANLVFTPNGDGHDTALLHIGWAALMWAPLWFALRPWIAPGQCRRIEGLVLAGLIAAGAGTGVAVFGDRAGLFLQDPIAAVIAPLPFIFALAAAAACEEWTHLDERQTAQTLRRLAVMAPIMLIAMVALLPWARINAPENLWWQFGSPFALAFLALCLVAWTLLRPSIRTLGYGIVLIALIDSALAIEPHRRFDDPDNFYPETPFVQSLHSLEGRVGGTGALANWPIAGNGLEQFYTPAGAYTNGHAEMMTTLAADPLSIRRTGSRDLLLDRDAIQGPFASVRPDLQVKRVFTTGAVLFEDLHMATRARIVPVSGEGPAIPAREIPTQTSIETVISTEANFASNLILADSALPGWEVTVNGEDGRIETVEGGFRAVQLPPGENEVVFRYRPASIVYGGLASFVAIGWVAVSAMMVWVRRKREPKREEY